MQTQQTLASPVLFMLFIALAAYAIAGSDKRWRTFGLILLSAALGLGIGVGVGIVMGNAPAGGTLAGLLLVVAGARVELASRVPDGTFVLDYFSASKFHRSVRVKHGAFVSA